MNILDKCNESKCGFFYPERCKVNCINHGAKPIYQCDQHKEAIEMKG